MLARDDTPVNWREKSIMRTMLLPEDLPAVRALAGRLADESLDQAAADGRIEVVSRLGRLVPIRICGDYFGFPGPDLPSMFRWSKATQSDMFRNPTNDPAVHAANVKAGEEMRAYVADLLADRAEPVATCPAEDVVTRLARLAKAGMAGLDAQRLVTNVCGLLVGAIETMSQAIVQAVEQILLRPDVTAAATAAARAGDEKTLDPIVWEALRFNPITGLVARYCERDAVLAPGTPHAAAVRAGTVVAACTGSAMFDPDAFPDPDTFRPGRPFDSYLHFGFGHHECLGKYVGVVAIPEAVRQVLLLPGLRRIDGDGGKIDFAGGPFPERFAVACDAA
jgi:cytochrome P450